MFIYLFTSFSEHRPAQRERARMGLMGPLQGAIPAQSHNLKRLATPPGSRPLLFSHSDVDSFTSHKNKSVKVLRERTYSFSSLSEKTRKSNHLQMSLQRQHFLLSYFKDPECWSGRGLNPRPPARQTDALPTELTRRRSNSSLRDTKF